VIGVGRVGDRGSAERCFVVIIFRYSPSMHILLIPLFDFRH